MKRISKQSRAKLEIRLIDKDAPCDGLSNEFGIGEECQINRCEVMRVPSREALKPALTVKYIDRDKVQISNKCDIPMICITDYEGYGGFNELYSDYLEEDGTYTDFELAPRKKAVITSDAVILIGRTPRLMIVFPENDNAEDFIDPKKNMQRPVYGPGGPLRRGGNPSIRRAPGRSSSAQ